MGDNWGLKSRVLAVGHAVTPEGVFVPPALLPKAHLHSFEKTAGKEQTGYSVRLILVLQEWQPRGTHCLKRI